MKFCGSVWMAAMAVAAGIRDSQKLINHCPLIWSPNLVPKRFLWSGTRHPPP